MWAKLGILALAVLLLASAVNAATIHGTVYNIELDPVRNARVDISTQPRQTFIATNGTYKFTVSPGTYFLATRVFNNGTVVAFASEQITISSEGDYVLDLIAFPDFSEEDILNATEQLNLEEAPLDDTSGVSWLTISLVAAILIIACVLVYVWQRKAHQHVTHEAEHKVETPEVNELPATERDDAKTVLDFIKQQGGRTTQKDIRKHSPLSEAKISLVIAELEHKGLIEKIKKGRGNIIVLK